MNPNPDNPNATPPPSLDEPKDPRWFWLTVSQYALICVVSLIFVYVLYHGISNAKDLADPDTARGLITFGFAVATIAIAMMMALTAMVTRDFVNAIAVGQEVLAILVGVVDTIVGFFF